MNKTDEEYSQLYKEYLQTIEDKKKEGKLPIGVMKTIGSGFGVKIVNGEPEMFDDFRIEPFDKNEFIVWMEDASKAKII